MMKFFMLLFLFTTGMTVQTFGQSDCQGSCPPSHPLSLCGRCWVDEAQARSGGCFETCGGGSGPTCTDGIQNGDETGIDCGGSCPNSCPATPTCSDGIQNGDETGVDCGGSCPNGCGSPPPPSGDLAFLEPVNGDKLLFIGQDLLSITNYINNCSACPTPGGVATYINLAGVLQNNFWGALGWTSADTPFGIDIDWGGGPLNAYSSAVGFPNSTVQIGLYLVGETNNIAGGGRDAEINQLADFFNALSSTAFYLRIGYEFDGNWNGYNGPGYISAYRRIVDILNQRGVNNVAYVWQASTSPIDDILDGGRENLLDFYPGDSYVDWFGMSWFLRPNETATVGATPSTQLFLANELVSLARQKGKPVMIAESSAQGYDITNRTNRNISPVWDGNAGQGQVNRSANQIWNEWFAPFFDFINNNDDAIKAVTYINAHWDVQGLWDPPYEQGYWGDTRIEANNTIENNWVNTITQSGWLHGSSNLNSLLNGMNVPGARKSDGTSVTVQNEARSFSTVITYPNPMNSVLYIRGDKDRFNYRVLDQTGRLLLQGQGQEVNVNHLKSGVYLLQIDGQTRRLIKK